jgi:hypothetical protein
MAAVLWRHISEYAAFIQPPAQFPEAQGYKYHQTSYLNKCHPLIYAKFAISSKTAQTILNTFH